MIKSCLKYSLMNWKYINLTIILVLDRQAMENRHRMMITGIEEILLKERPDCIIVYGDTNSTLAGSLAASKLHFPVIHIEAGLRSFNKTMPEELNRIMSDHSSTLLFAPTNAAFKNLMNEGFRPENSPPYTIDNPKIYLTGDIMYDNMLFFARLAEKKKADFLEQLSLESGQLYSCNYSQGYKYR